MPNGIVAVRRPPASPRQLPSARNISNRGCGAARGPWYNAVMRCAPAIFLAFLTLIPRVAAGDDDEAEVCEIGLLSPISVSAEQLRRPISVDFNAMPLERALERIGSAAGWPIKVNWDALNAAGVNKAAHVTL